MIHGPWKSISELEDNIGLDELRELVTARRESIRDDRKFLAALKGHKLDDDGKEESAFDRVQREVNEQIKEDALSSDDVIVSEYAAIGIQVVTE